MPNVCWRIPGYQPFTSDTYFLYVSHPDYKVNELLYITYAIHLNICIGRW